jgi:hypothetical protein
MSEVRQPADSTELPHRVEREVRFPQEGCGWGADRITVKVTRAQLGTPEFATWLDECVFTRLYRAEGDVLIRIVK